jgi:hypothetical protein
MRVATMKACERLRQGDHIAAIDLDCRSSGLLDRAYLVADGRQGSLSQQRALAFHL